MLRKTNPEIVKLYERIDCLRTYIDKALPAARVEEAAERLDLDYFNPEPGCGTTGCVLGHYHVARGREMWRHNDSVGLACAINLAFSELQDKDVIIDLFASGWWSLDDRENEAYGYIVDCEHRINELLTCAN